MSQPKAIHIWMTDDRSLCDRRAARPHRAVSEFADDDEFERYLEENFRAPACGPCLVLAGRVRRSASALLVHSDGRVYPEDPTEAWSLLRSTRWEDRLDLDEFLNRSGLDRIRYDAVDDAVDPGSVADMADEFKEREALLRKQRADYLAKQAKGE